MSIRLSEKYGVNPTVQKCFWCGGDIGVALLGRLKGDAEAPRSAVLDYSLCNDCKKKREEYVQFIEAVHNPTSEGQPEIQEGVWPTGRNAWVKDRAVRNILNDKELADGIIKSRVAFVAPEAFDGILGIFDEINKRDEDEVDTEATEEKAESAEATEEVAEATEEATEATEEEAETTEATESSEVIRTSVYPVKARKTWACYECGAKIKPYDEFERRDVYTGHKLEKRRICKECHEKFVNEVETSNV